uniref:Retrotransposon gag domain-containing protein n=1 Tax=Cajanus cajan TaxID=3821 RepID=A0A151UGU9_CAJCA
MTTPPPSSLDLLIDQVSKLTARIGDLSSEVASIKHQPHPPFHSSFSKAPKIRLNCPRFDGSNALDWIFAVTRFFEYHQTPESERLQILSFYMEGPALSWFQWMERNNMLPSWKEFLQSLETRFSPSRFQNVKGRLCKLFQTGSVLQYLNEFEGLANRVTDVPPSFLLECFISGLCSDIQREVLAFQPVPFSEAAELAKLHEENFNSMAPSQRSPSIPISRSSPTPQRPALLPTLVTPTIPFKRLSASEMQIRRDKGLC